MNQPGSTVWHLYRKRPGFNSRHPRTEVLWSNFIIWVCHQLKAFEALCNFTFFMVTTVVVLLSICGTYIMLETLIIFLRRQLSEVSLVVACNSWTWLSKLGPNYQRGFMEPFPTVQERLTEYVSTSLTLPSMNLVLCSCYQSLLDVMWYSAVASFLCALCILTVPIWPLENFLH